LKIDWDHIVFQSQKGEEEAHLGGKWVLKNGGLWCQELFEWTYFLVFPQLILTTVENQLNKKGEVCKTLAFLTEPLF